MKRLKVAFLVITSMICANWALGQQKGDSLRAIWEDKSAVDSFRFQALDEYYELYNQIYPDSSLNVLNYHFSLAVKKRDTKEQFSATKRRGNIHRLKGHYVIAMNAYEEAEKLAKLLQDSTLIATIIGNKGNIFIYRKDYPRATKSFSQALKIYQETNDRANEAHMLTSLGSVFLIIHNHDMALQYYKRALKILENLGDQNRRLAIVFMNIGWVNYEKKQFNEAKKYYKKGLGILLINNEKFFIANCYGSLSLCHMALNQLDKAKEYANKNLALNRELGIDKGIIEAEIILAKLAYKTDIEDATKKGESILERLPVGLSKDLQRDLYELLYKCYKAQNKSAQSLLMLEKYTMYQDSIQQEQNNFAVAREAVKNDFEVQLYETKLKNEEEKTELKLAQLKRTFGLISVSAIIILALLLYFRASTIKSKKRRKALLDQIRDLKQNQSTELVVDSNKFELSREKIETAIARKLNETDWTVLNILLNDPVVTNKEIAEKVFMSVDGIGSSLRRMYEYFEIKESKYKKISLLLEAIKVSNSK